jgi:ABC-type multidrug transport system fused ATPase/permease subunit
VTLAPFIILDEATAALSREADPDAVAALPSGIIIRTLCRARPTRSSSSAGRVAQRGTHAELVADVKGAYRALVDEEGRR